LTLKTEGDVKSRSARLARALWIATMILLVLISVETLYVRPELLPGMLANPIAWVALVAAAAGAIGVFTGLFGKAEQRTFLGGCALIAGLLGAAAASSFPVMLHSTLNDAYSITAWTGSSDSVSLKAAAYWWPFAFAFALVYFGFIGKYYRGRVKLSTDTQRPY